MVSLLSGVGAFGRRGTIPSSKRGMLEWKTLSGKLRLWVFFGLRIGPNWLLCLGPIGVNLISCSLVFVVFAAPFCGLGGF